MVFGPEGKGNERTSERANERRGHTNRQREERERERKGKRKRENGDHGGIDGN